MHALLLVAHGSRRQQSNDEVTLLANALRDACSQDYPIVHAGFLELASPSIPEGIERCVLDGATRITVLPYFLNSGRHVVEDVPQIVASARNRHPGIEIAIAPHLGASAMMVDLLIASAISTPVTENV
ncbi:MAG: CbiX/SirB N-terminal domain-containing protein [Thiotrichales bacterium]|nr:MAG: CbiX/SirB N-terminal domain-containing protein [Thiotrichales bacterium]